MMPDMPRPLASGSMARCCGLDPERRDALPDDVGTCLVAVAIRCEALGLIALGRYRS